MNWIARRGDPDEDATEGGLGVERANEGRSLGLLGSGVCGGDRGCLES